MKELIQLGDTYDQQTPSVDISNDIYAGPLNAGVAQNITVPTGATTVIFGATGSFWYKEGSNAVIPTTFSVSSVELNPTMRTVDAGTVISVISPYNIYLSASFYRT